MELCKDLGLNRLQRGIFLGKLGREERRSLEGNLRKYLTGASDNFYIIPLCNKCWGKKYQSVMKPRKKILQPSKPFEIIN